MAERRSWGGSTEELKGIMLPRWVVRKCGLVAWRILDLTTIAESLYTYKH